MKKIILSLVVILVVFCIFGVWKNGRHENIIAKLGERALLPEERGLKYRVYFFGIIPMGEGIIEPAKSDYFQEKKAYYLKGAATNLAIFNRIFAASAVIESYVDSDKLTPFIFKQKTKLANWPQMYKEVTYDQTNNVMTLNGVKRKILPDTYDPISAIYAIRKRDLSGVKEIELNINTNQKNYVLSAALEHKEINIKGDKYNLVFAKADIRRRDKNNPYHQTKLDMVILKGKENTPVLIRVFNSGLLIYARLIDILPNP